MNAPIRHADAFHKLIHENHMYGLWEIAGQMTPQPRPEAIPHLWKWSLLERVVEQSCTSAWWSSRAPRSRWATSGARCSSSIPA